MKRYFSIGRIRIVYSLFLIFSEIFLPATLPRLHSILQLEIRAIFGFLIPDSELPKYTKTCVKSYKIAYKAQYTPPTHLNCRVESRGRCTVCRNYSSRRLSTLFVEK